MTYAETLYKMPLWISVDIFLIFYIRKQYLRLNYIYTYLQTFFTFRLFLKNILVKALKFLKSQFLKDCLQKIVIRFKSDAPRLF